MSPSWRRHCRSRADDCRHDLHIRTHVCMRQKCIVEVGYTYNKLHCWSMLFGVAGGDDGAERLECGMHCGLSVLVQENKPMPSTLQATTAASRIEWITAALERVQRLLHQASLRHITSTCRYRSVFTSPSAPPTLLAGQHALPRK